MSWQCKLVTFEHRADAWSTEKPIGTMWFTDSSEFRADRLSNDHTTNRPDTPVLWVQLPGGSMCLDAKSFNPESAQWSRTGEPPNVTVTPSINEVGIWHGWIKDGVISDDVSGKSS